MKMISSTKSKYYNTKRDTRKVKRSHRILALFLNVIMLNALLPYNMLYANNNGPKAPEAGSFEPVDATDMVNLLTGDFTYVLPLLNIPSPEGGYPLALSYHAGIAMDQEASWTGLGWNINPGVINRNLNGFPDDYSNTKIFEHFYDEGGSEESYVMGLGYANSGGSIGVDFSWGTNKAFGGSVNFGIGIPLGADGSGGSLGVSGSIGQNNSIGVGISPGMAGGLSLGMNISESSGVGGSLGMQAPDNSGGYSISANSSGSIGMGMNIASGKNNSLGLNFQISKGGIGISGSVQNRNSNNKIVGGGGVGANFSLTNNIQQGDYNIKFSGWTIPIFIPTTVGVFSGYFGKQKIEWDLNRTKGNVIYGAANFDKTSDGNEYCVDCAFYNVYQPDTNNNGYYGDSGDDFPYQRASGNPKRYCGLNLIQYQSRVGNRVTTIHTTRAERITTYENCNSELNIETLMDVYEFPLDQISFTNLDENNAIFPNKDSFDVEAQGYSGSMSIKYFENGNLFSLAKKNQTLSLSYGLTATTSSGYASPEFTFETKPEFYFDNSFSSYLGTSVATFGNNVDANYILDYHGYNDFKSKPRKKQGEYVQYFTNEEIFQNNPEIYERGFIRANTLTNLTRKSDPKGIGAFTITAPNGKSYHYSIPVLNHAVSTRNIGGIKNSDGRAKSESKSYFERLQDTPYATHWLLTAITGADYIDYNQNGFVDENDFGYWVEFDYGMWSEAYAWKTPYGKDYNLSNDDDDFKSRVEGFKEIYYLDRIKTRTHSALFIKSPRMDDLGHNWKYNSVDWDKVSQNSNDFKEVFNIPSQRSLKLDEIILLKNENTTSKYDSKIPGFEQKIIFIDFPSKKNNGNVYSYYGDVYNKEDISESVRQNAIKIINFEYKDYNQSLARNTPNTVMQDIGRLTLEKVYFGGKEGKRLIPPYLFDYYNSRSYSSSQKNEWGYYSNIPWNWSLKSIINPEGAAINVKYESDDFHKPALQNGRLFTRYLKFTFLDLPPKFGGSPDLAPTSNIRIKVELDNNDPDYVNNQFSLKDYFDVSKPFFMDLFYQGFINYNQGKKINGFRYSRYNIDVFEKQASIISINEVENSMIVSVNAKSPYCYGNAINASPVSYYKAEASNYQNGTNFIENKKQQRYDLYWEEEYNKSDKHRFSLFFKIVGNKDVYDLKNGGVRVKDIEVSDGINRFYTDYKYHQNGYNSNPENSNYRSSGTVSYIPSKQNNPIPYSSELPAPKIMYEYVTVQDRDAAGTLQNEAKYKFNVLTEKSPNSADFGEFLKFEKNTSLVYNYNRDKNVDISNITVHDNLGALGQLLSMKITNNKNQIISKTSNEYFSKINRPDDQGISQQSYQTYKKIQYKENLNRKGKWIVNSSTRKDYAQALKSSTTIKSGFKFTTDFLEYDKVTGSTILSQTKLSNGFNIKNVVFPAYSVPEYGNQTNNGFGMGSKVDNINNKNMLVQNAGNLTQIKIGDEWKTIGADITTWNNNWTYYDYKGATYTPSNGQEKIWRKHQTYVWKGDLNPSDGSYLGYNGDFDGFKWGLGDSQTNTDWFKVSTTKTYDHYSMPLEVFDVNNNYVSTKMGDNETKVYSVSNAPYMAHFYSGAEDLNDTTRYFGGQVSTGTGTTIINSSTHTGLSAIQANANSKAFIVKPINGDYRASVWVKKNSGYANTRLKVVNVGEIDPIVQETVFAGDWVQYNFKFTQKSPSAEVYVYNKSTTGIFDDFRMYPVESSLTSYVYNEWDELTYILGANNMGTQYVYDEAGRLRKVYAEVKDEPGSSGGYKLAKEINYNYKRVAELDVNGNGILDPVETYDPLSLNLSLESPSNRFSQVKAEVSGGSGKYQYRWYQTPLRIEDNEAPFGSWTSATSVNSSVNCATKINYIMCEIKDIETGKTYFTKIAHINDCSGHGSGGILEPAGVN